MWLRFDAQLPHPRKAAPHELPDLATFHLDALRSGCAHRLRRWQRRRQRQHPGARARPYTGTDASSNAHSCSNTGAHASPDACKPW